MTIEALEGAVAAVAAERVLDAAALRGGLRALLTVAARAQLDTARPIVLGWSGRPLVRAVLQVVEGPGEPDTLDAELLRHFLPRKMSALEAGQAVALKAEALEPSALSSALMGPGMLLPDDDPLSEPLADVLCHAVTGLVRERLGEGPDVDVEAHYNNELRAIETFRFYKVVAGEPDPVRELSLADAKAMDVESVVGDDLGVLQDAAPLRSALVALLCQWSEAGASEAIASAEPLDITLSRLDDLVDLRGAERALEAMNDRDEVPISWAIAREKVFSRLREAYDDESLSWQFGLGDPPALPPLKERFEVALAPSALTELIAWETPDAEGFSYQERPELLILVDKLDDMARRRTAGPTVNPVRRLPLLSTPCGSARVVYRRDGDARLILRITRRG